MSAGTIAVCLDEPGAYLDPNLYGHFAEHLGACTGGGLWVGECSPIRNLGAPLEVAVEPRGGRACAGTVTTLAAPGIHAHNTFEAPEAVQPHHARHERQRLAPHTPPPASVTVFSVPL